MYADNLLLVLIAVYILEFPFNANSESTTGYSTVDATQTVQTTVYPVTLNTTDDFEGAGSGAGSGSGASKPRGKIPLYLGGFFALPGGGWDGSGVLVAVEMALDHINNEANILEDYELKMVWSDTRVS